MVKTTEPVNVPTKDNRSIELKTVYAEITQIKIMGNKYIININEFVYDDIETLDENENPTTFQQKRNLVTVPRVRTKTELSNFITLLKDETQLTAYGLTQYIGVYETLNQLEKNDFVAQLAHLIENNRDSIRNTTWEEHNLST